MRLEVPRLVVGRQFARGFAPARSDGWASGDNGGSGFGGLSSFFTQKTFDIPFSVTTGSASVIGKSGTIEHELLADTATFGHAGWEWIVPESPNYIPSSRWVYASDSERGDISTAPENELPPLGNDE